MSSLNLINSDDEYECHGDNGHHVGHRGQVFQELHVGLLAAIGCEKVKDEVHSVVYDFA